MEIVNIAAYKFVEIPNPAEWRAVFKERCQKLGLLGTILLACEGINLFIAAEREAVDAFLRFLREDPLFDGRFADIVVKESISKYQPFHKMKVKLKKEIITMKRQMICPDKTSRAPAVDPQKLKQWLDQGHDDNGREVVMVDTRNNYEIELGTFEGALQFPIENFSEFPQAFTKTAEANADLAEKTIVSFCTGGIRCEKAALFLRTLNLDHVYQLDGGILRYFEEIGGSHWNGECFVFDDRFALDPQLMPTKKIRSSTGA